MTNGGQRDDDLDALAGEYVLGLLSPEDASAFENRVDQDPNVRVALARTRERLLEIDLRAPSRTPSAELWPRIEARLEDVPSADVVAMPSRAPEPRGVSFRKSAAPFWRGFAAASIVALLVATAAFFASERSEPRLLVVLLNENAEPVSIVEAFDGHVVRVVPLAELPVPQGKTLQVWTLPDPDTGPVSLGLLPTGRAQRLLGPDLPTPKIDQLYEITIEPAGGSPTGKPTGPIVGKGLARMPRT